VVLHDGAVVEQGSHQQLVEQNGWYAEMAPLQAVGWPGEESSVKEIDRRPRLPLP
jgi:hypothetical protein